MVKKFQIRKSTEKKKQQKRTMRPAISKKKQDPGEKQKKSNPGACVSPLPVHPRPSNPSVHGKPIPQAPPIPLGVNPAPVPGVDPPVVALFCLVFPVVCADCWQNMNNTMSSGDCDAKNQPIPFSLCPCPRLSFPHRRNVSFPHRNVCQLAPNLSFCPIRSLPGCEM